MGVRHVQELGDLLKAEAGRKYYVTELGAKHHTIYDRQGGYVDAVEGFSVNAVGREYALKSVLTTKTLARMRVQSLPGCCGVCVLHSFNGEAKYVTEFIRVGIKAAKRAGYGQVLFTLRSDSAILESFRPDANAADGDDGRVDWSAFRNGKTSNLVTLVTIYLHQEERAPQRRDTDGE